MLWKKRKLGNTSHSKCHYDVGTTLEHLNLRWNDRRPCCGNIGKMLMPLPPYLASSELTAMMHDDGVYLHSPSRNYALWRHWPSHYLHASPHMPCLASCALTARMDGVLGLPLWHPPPLALLQA